MHSLSRRLLISVSLPLALFFGIMMLVLDSGFRAFSERSLRELLDAQMVSLIAAADPQADGGYAPPAEALEPRLATPHSGLYAQIRSGEREWRSPSTLGLPSDFGPLLPHGERSFAYANFGHDRVAIESRAIQFQDSPNEAGTFTFSVAVRLSPYEEQLWQFRRELLGWFIGLMLALLLTLAALLHWVLAPVRRLEREIHEVEDGRSEKLGGGYPRELSGVAGNLNALLLGERKRVASLPRHARQSRPQPEDAAGGHALEPAAGRRCGAPGRGDRSHERHHRASAQARRRLRRGAPGVRHRSRSHRWLASCARRC